MDWISTIGSISSTVGLLITLYVFFELRDIKKSYLYRARAPVLLDSLSRKASTLNDVMSDMSKVRNRQEAAAIAGEIEADLDSLLEKVPKAQKTRIKQLRYLIRKNQGSRWNWLRWLTNAKAKKTSVEFSKAETREMQRQLRAVLTDLNNLFEDKKWS